MAPERRPERSVELRQWFDASELADCPACGARALVAVREGVGYCVECRAMAGVPVKRGKAGHPGDDAVADLAT